MTVDVILRKDIRPAWSKILLVSIVSGLVIEGGKEERKNKLKTELRNKAARRGWNWR